MAHQTSKSNEIKLSTKRYIVSKTGAKGIIEYANDYFVEICGYSKDELIGKPHNIVRHSDMPRIAFKLMWDRIKQGKNFVAVVKNLAKNGSYYWVVADFEPKTDLATKEIISHTAFRKAASQKAIDTMEPIYAKLLELEKDGGMQASEKFLLDFLKEKNTTYDEFIKNLTKEKGFFSRLFGM